MPVMTVGTGRAMLGGSEGDPIGDFLRLNAQFLYRLDEASGNALDAGPNGLHLTDNNTVTSGAGKVSALARSFNDADSETFSRANNAAFVFGAADWSFSLWVFSEQDPAEGFDIFGRWGGTNEIRLVHDNGSILLQTSGGGTSLSEPMSSDAWHLVNGVYTHATTTLDLYLDNVLVDTDATASIAADTQDFYVGARGASGAFYRGRLNQFYKGAFAFTEAHRNHFWNSGAGRVV